MKILVAFPSIGRQQKAVACIHHLLASSVMVPDHDVYIKAFFNKPIEATFVGTWFGMNPNVLCYVLSNEHRAPLMWDSLLMSEDYDVFCYLSDDVRVHETMLQEAVKCMLSKFPDLDGVVGLNMVNCPSNQYLVKAAFGIIGRKFADRFPNRQVFCPEYAKFYIDQELEQYARSIGKFHFCEEAKLVHDHPAFTETPADDTHKMVRNFLVTDNAIFKARSANGFVWGRTFELVTVRP